MFFNEGERFIFVGSRESSRKISGPSVSFKLAWGGFFLRKFLTGLLESLVKLEIFKLLMNIYGWKRLKQIFL